MKLAIDRDRLLRELDELASITDCPQSTDPHLPRPQRAVTRIVFTPRDTEARQWLRHKVDIAGFGWREDAVGNTFIRWSGAQPDLPPVATGSHIDAIPFAGMYDGTVGVLGGLEAMRALRRAGFTPRRSIELILLTSEEPTRFGIGCLGSRLLNGALSPTAADALPDRLHETEPNFPMGGSLQSARNAAGYRDSLDNVPLHPGTYAAFLELHIEQGPLLEREHLDLGIVTHIAGPASYRLTIHGVGGHAGALLMPDRRDALCASAEIVLALERLVQEANRQAGREDTVGTIGKLDVRPGAVNAVPSQVMLMVDLRSVDLAARDAVWQQLQSFLVDLQHRRDIRIETECLNADKPTLCEPTLIRLLEDAAKQAGATSRRMGARAYHDSSFMALRTPVAMLFIPCRGGVSHRPDEYADSEAIHLGVQVLASTLAKLAG